MHHHEFGHAKPIALNPYWKKFPEIIAELVIDSEYKLDVTRNSLLPHQLLSLYVWMQS